MKKGKKETILLLPPTSPISVKVAIITRRKLRLVVDHENGTACEKGERKMKKKRGRREKEEKNVRFLPHLLQ